MAGFTVHWLAVLWAAAQSPMMTFHREDGRWLATVDRRLFDTDFVIRTHTSSDAQTPEPLGTSNALRIRQAGDSLVFLEYAGTVQGQPQYRHRATHAIRRTVASRAVVVDAAPLWAAVQPRREAGGILLHEDAAGCCERPQNQATIRSIDEALERGQFSVLPLPREPMRPRLYDPRISFMYSGKDDGQRYIYRWRLEKKDPAAPVSDVVKPIPFRINANVPERWIPSIKRAIEWWIPVLESVGFRNAIVIRMPGDPQPEGEGENVISWEMTERTGGVANHNVDPRSGEILSTTILLRDGLVANGQQGYFAMAAALDPRARPPYPDSLETALVVYPITHEVGHALGLHHNFRGSTMYPTDSLRRPSFLRRMGTVASVMGYSYVNYVAQPEDKVPAGDLLPRIGPYDQWILNWGYRPIPDAPTPEAEQPTLERWRAPQDTMPHLRGALQLRPLADGLDPANVDFLMGDDHLKGADYGIRNAARAAALLDAQAAAGSAESGGKLGDRALRSRIVTRWKFYLFGVADMVGGRMPQAPFPADLGQLRYQPVDSTRQMQAARSLLGRVFYGQDELVSTYVTPVPRNASPSLIMFDTVNAGWTSKDWRQAQKDLLTRLLANRRLERVAQYAPAVLPPLCGALVTLDQQLASAAANTADEATQAHAKALAAILAPALASSGNACDSAKPGTAAPRVP